MSKTKKTETADKPKFATLELELKDWKTIRNSLNKGIREEKEKLKTKLKDIEKDPVKELQANQAFERKTLQMNIIKKKIEELL